ncbi:hypothetical protein DFH09DRAFT_1102873 [Mycena vulgaris]|nr:hypothetical protein DFH09DRAFT_1102873 [Mycena vulgaris]
MLYDDWRLPFVKAFSQTIERDPSQVPCDLTNHPTGRHRFIDITPPQTSQWMIKDSRSVLNGREMGALVRLPRRRRLRGGVPRTDDKEMVRARAQMAHSRLYHKKATALPPLAWLCRVAKGHRCHQM